MLTRAVSTNLVIANVFIFAKTSPSFGCCLGPFIPFLSIYVFLFIPIFSMTPTVNYPKDVINSAKDWDSKSNVLVNKESNES